MNHSKLQSIASDGSLSFNDSTEILQYVELITGILPDDDDYCTINDNKYYYNDMISPLFDIFTAICLDFPQLSQQQQTTINQLAVYSERNLFRNGSPTPTLNDIYDDPDNNDYYCLCHIYELLGGTQPNDD